MAVLRSAYVCVEQTPAVVAFYSDVLGLSVAFADGQRWTQFAKSPASFAVAAPEEAPEGVRGAVLVFEVDVEDDLLDRVTAAGGTVLGSRDMGEHGRTVTVTDPAGTVIQLFTRS